MQKQIEVEDVAGKALKNQDDVILELREEIRRLKTARDTNALVRDNNCKRAEEALRRLGFAVKPDEFGRSQGSAIGRLLQVIEYQNKKVETVMEELVDLKFRWESISK